MLETRHATLYWKRLATITLVALTMMAVIIPSFVGFSQTDPSATVHDKLADRLTTILNKLDQELDQLSGDKFPALKDQLDAISSLLDDLVSSLETPPNADKEGSTAKQEVLKLDLMLHRLVIFLERIADVNAPASTPAQGMVRKTISDLRVWVDGYIEGATAKMGPIEARRYEEMARTLLTDVGKHLAKIASQARPKAEDPSRLDVIIEHIRLQLRILDRFIVRNFGAPRRLPRQP